MFRLQSTAHVPGILTVLLILMAASSSRAWDTTVYARNCNPETAGSGGYYSLTVFNGNDGVCMHGKASGTDHISFLEKGSYHCNSNSTGKCKISQARDDNKWSCEKAKTVGSGQALLIYGASAGNMITATLASPDANCCAATLRAGDGDCETWFRECAVQNISGASCVSDYVPCRAGGKDRDTCLGQQSSNEF